MAVVIHLGARVTGAKATEKGVSVKYEDKQGSKALEVDRLVVAVGRRAYTDGLVDASNSGGEPFGEEQMRNVLLEHKSYASPEEMVGTLCAASEEHLAGHPRDDEKARGCGRTTISEKGIFC